MLNFSIKKLTPAEEVKLAVREAMITEQAVDQMLDNAPPVPLVVTESEIPKRHKRTVEKLVDENFPFDESQLAAIEGLVEVPYGCLTGAAGTGKTTSTKKLVDRLMDGTTLNWVDMQTYFKRGADEVDSGADREDDYEVPVDYIPSIAMVAFTGKATQQIKKNFPRSWHGNIMTIHRLLAFVPEWYTELQEDGSFRNKMRFVPTYTADNLLPWDIILIDESGMLGLILWHQLWAACKPGTRIYMVGDINQLPPVHGKSIFGFALAKWPAFELTHIHRQQGSNNMIVDNAWRVLKGQLPKSEGNFQMLELKGDAVAASRMVRAIVYNLAEVKKIYDPIRDTIITPINGEDGATGYALGQLPLNRELALRFNPANANPRYIIDGGRERKMFAEGDKVMATKNDHDRGITNGMQGIISAITRNPDFLNDPQRFGTVQEVNDYLAASPEEEHAAFTMDDLTDDFESLEEAKEKAKEKEQMGRGPSSHIVTVKFGEGDHAFEIDFRSLSEVGSLMTSYVVTCHKMQGGEAPVIIILVHDAIKHMLDREWLYTAITRASQKCILLYTPTALRTSINKQNIKGSTLKEKIESFRKWSDGGKLNVGMKVILPDVVGYDKESEKALVGSRGTDMAKDTPADSEAERSPEPTPNLPAVTQSIQSQALSVMAAHKSGKLTATTATRKLSDLLQKTKERRGEVEPRVEHVVEVRYVFVEPSPELPREEWDHGAVDITPEKVESEPQPKMVMIDYTEIERHIDGYYAVSPSQSMLANAAYMNWSRMQPQYNPQLLLTHTPPAKPKTFTELMAARKAAK